MDFDYPGFVHTVLVDMRARLARPDRIFQVTLDVARQAGLVGRRRVLDSTPIDDAVATMDTITLLRSAIRGLRAAADTDLVALLRAVITSRDDDASTAKPQIDWDDAAGVGTTNRATTGLRGLRADDVVGWSWSPGSNLSPNSSAVTPDPAPVRQLLGLGHGRPFFPRLTRTPWWVLPGTGGSFAVSYGQRRPAPRGGSQVSQRCLSSCAARNLRR